MTNKKRKTYLGGNMTNVGAKLLRQMEREKLEELPNIDLYNPVDNEEINDKSRAPQAEDIFKQDTKALLEADTTIFDATGSPGTTTEIGQVWGINYVLRELRKSYSEALEKQDRVLNSSEGKIYQEVREEASKAFYTTFTSKVINDIMLKIPYKDVYWHNSDIRNVKGITETGLRRSYGFNQYLHGCLLDMAGEENTFDEIVRELREKEEDEDSRGIGDN